MASLYGRLFIYRARESREPLENFLSEAIVDLLNRMPKEEVVSFVETALLPAIATDAWRRFLSENPGSKLTWSTEQYADRYRVDILLQVDGRSNLLVVENKIASPLRKHKQPDSDVLPSTEETDEREAQALKLRDQLETYGLWLSKHCAADWQGAIVLLTHRCPAPDSFAKGDCERYGVPWQKICRWSEVRRWLKKSLHSWSTSETRRTAWFALAYELTNFLEERDMAAEYMTPYDLAVAEIYTSSNSDKRIDTTFDEIGEHLKDCLSDPPISKRNGWEFDIDGCAIWDWFYLKSPPALKWDWYIAWGLRFPTKSQWWQGFEPPLPSVTHAFITFGSEGKKDKPAIKTLPARLLPKGWLRDDEQMLVVRPLSDFPSAPEEFPSVFASWARQQIQALKPALSYLIPKTKAPA